MTPSPAQDDPGARYRATLVLFAEQLAGMKRCPPGADPVGDAGPLSAAAEMALVVYPGPVGEIVAREIRAYREIGHRFGGDALIHRLVAHLSPHHSTGQPFGSAAEMAAGVQARKAAIPDGADGAPPTTATAGPGTRRPGR